MTGIGFEPPVSTPTWGVLGVCSGLRTPTTAHASRSSSTAPSTWRATPPTSARCATPSTRQAASRCRIYCASLRTPEPDLLETLSTVDAMVVTVLAAGGAVPATVGAGGDDDTWNVAHLAALDIPILQGLCLTSPRAQWSEQRRRHEPTRRRDAGRRPRVRRPDHHGSVLVQGDRRRRAHLLRRRPRTVRPGRGSGGAARPASTTSRRRTSASRWCSRRTRPSTPASATPSVSTPPPAPWRCCPRCARPAIRSVRCPASTPATATR